MLGTHDCGTNSKCLYQNCKNAHELRAITTFLGPGSNILHPQSSNRFQICKVWHPLASKRPKHYVELKSY